MYTVYACMFINSSSLESTSSATTSKFAMFQLDPDSYCLYFWFLTSRTILPMWLLPMSIAPGTASIPLTLVISLGLRLGLQSFAWLWNTFLMRHGLDGYEENCRDVFDALIMMANIHCLWSEISLGYRQANWTGQGSLLLLLISLQLFNCGYYMHGLCMSWYWCHVIMRVKWTQFNSITRNILALNSVLSDLETSTLIPVFVLSTLKHLKSSYR